MLAGKEIFRRPIEFNQSTNLLFSILGRAPHIILPYVASAFALGIVSGRITPCGETLTWIIALVMAGGVVAAGVLRLRGLAFVFLLAFFMAAGSIHVRPSILPPKTPDHIYNLINSQQPGTLTGTLVQMPQIIDPAVRPRTRLLLAVSRLLRPEAAAESAGTSGYPATGLVRLTMNGLPPPELIPGDELMVRAELSRPDGPTVPGAFNYQEYLATQNIWITGWVESPVHLMKVHSIMPRPAWGLLSAIRYLPERIRYRLAVFLDKSLEPRTAGLYKAILIGDTANLDPQLFEDFRTSGCVHILSISGSHIGLLALLLIGCTTWLLKRSTRVILRLPVRKTAIGLSLLPLTGYAMIAGFNAPVVRSLIMAAALMASLLLDRQKSVINNIALAALIILIWQPASLFTASCQLTFVAVIGIALVSPLISRLLQTEPAEDPAGDVDQITTTEETIEPTAQNQVDFIRQRSLAMAKWLSPAIGRAGNWAGAGFMVSLAATLATAPLTAYHFNMVSLVGPLANLLVEPLICLWALVIGLFASCVLPLAPGLSAILFQVGGVGLHLSETLASWFAGLPLAALWLPTPSAGEVIACYVLLLALLGLGLGKPARPGWRIGLGIAAALSAAILVLSPACSHVMRNSKSDTTVTVLDVGQGSAILAELPHGRAILIDGGGPATENFNVGERLIAPFLWKLRLTRLEAVVITHPHADHYNGLFFILKRFRPKQMWINGLQGDEPAYGQLLELAGELGVEVRIGRSGEVLYESGMAWLTCLVNPIQPDGNDVPGEATTRNQRINDSSLVLRLEQRGNPGDKGITFLFPGDIGRDAETALMQEAAAALDVNVLISPHHGSLTSNSREFLETATPSYLVVSASRGFAGFSRNPDNLEKVCRQQDIALLTTAVHGSIYFTTDGRSLVVRKGVKN